MNAEADFADRRFSFRRQLAHFVGNDGETSSGLAGTGRFDGGVECQQIGLSSHMFDQLHQRLERASLLDDLCDANLILFGRDPSVALSRSGLVERAQGGTLVLDEIESIPERAKAQLLSLIDSSIPGNDHPRQVLDEQADALDEASFAG